MTSEIINLAAIGPEILILTGACVVLMWDAFMSHTEKGKALTYWLSLVTLLLGSGMVFLTFGEYLGSALHGHFFKDVMGDFLKLFIYLMVFARFIYFRNYLKRSNLFEREFFVLGLFAVLGMSVTISAGSFITIFMGLELLSLPLYTMVALEDTDSVLVTDTAMKYFVRGAIASSILLYGMSLLYGATGTLNLVQVSGVVQQLVTEESVGQKQILLILGMIFVIVGTFFKFGSLPFHRWIYQNVPIPINLLLGTVPQAIAFAMVIRLLIGILDSLVVPWQQIFTILALLSITAGINSTQVGTSNFRVEKNCL